MTSSATRQQDAHEPPSPAPPAPLSDEAMSRLSAEEQADRAWFQHLSRNDSDITRMFCGQLQSRISCLSCGNISHCFDPFFDLSVPLPSRQSDAGAAAAGGGGGGGIGAGRRGSAAGSRAGTVSLLYSGNVDLSREETCKNGAYLGQ